MNRNQIWYRKNRKWKKAHSKLWRRCNPDYFKNWYQRNKEWHKARERLKTRCMPDKGTEVPPSVRGTDLERDDPWQDMSFEERREIRRECKKLYQRKLRLLRLVFGRNPDNGRKVDDEEELQRMREESQQYQEFIERNEDTVEKVLDKESETGSDDSG